MSERDCTHGLLARVCPICDLEAQRDEALAQRDEALDALEMLYHHQYGPPTEGDAYRDAWREAYHHAFAVLRKRGRQT